MPRARPIPSAGIRLKLFLACMALTVVSVGVTRAIATSQLDGDFVTRIRENLSIRLALVAGEASRMPWPAQRLPAWDALADSLGEKAQGRVTLIARDGTLLGDSELSMSELAHAENHLARPEVAEALAVGRGFSARRSPTLDRRMMYVAVPMKRGDQVLGVARLATPLTDVDAVVASVGRTASLGAALALLVATALAGATAQALSRRTRRLTATALKMSGGSFEARADETGRDELTALGRALNGILASHVRAVSDLSAQRRLLERVVEAMREGVLVLDRAGRVVRANSALRQMLLLGPDLVGQPLDGRSNPALAQHLARATTEHFSGEIELSGLKPRRLLIDAGPLPGQEGGVVAVCIDVTELRRLQAAPRDFASSVSHELRAPLAAMAEAASGLQTEPPLATSAARALLDTIERQAGRLQAMVSEILELSRLHAQDFRLRLEPQDLERTVTELLSRLRPQAEKKRVHLVVQIPRTAASVLADRQALELLLSQILEHVLGSCPRDATLAVHTVPDGPAAVISVAGGGPEMSERGLELSLLTELAQAMRGRLTVAEERQGRVFKLALPRA